MRVLGSIGMGIGVNRLAVSSRPRSWVIFHQPLVPLGKCPVIVDLGGTRSRLHRERLYRAARRPEVLDQAVQDIKTATEGSVVPLALDITTDGASQKMIKTALDNFGRVDIVVNNAGTSMAKPFEDVQDEEWEWDFELKVWAAVRLMQAGIVEMRKVGGGRIINISSGLAVRGLWNSVAASASQGAIHQLTSALALEWSRSNIRVNAIGAGWMTTDPHTKQGQQELLARFLPSRRKGHPTDLCALLVYLASDASDFVTGQTIFIDGGALAHA